MSTFWHLFKMQCVRLLTKGEVKYALTAMLVIVVAAFAESCALFYGADLGELPSAAYGWVGNMDNMQIQTMHVLYIYLIFLIAASIFADSFFTDLKCRVSNMIATRCSLQSYLASTALLAFLGGFFVILVPLIFSQLLALLVFPAIPEPGSFAGNINTPAYDDFLANLNTQNALFPSVYFNHPYLSNLFFIFYAALWAGIMSLMAFVVSLFTRKSRLIILGVPTLVFLLSFYILPSSYILPYYLYPSTLSADLLPTFVFVAPLAVLIALVSLTAVALRRKKDVLL
jgi:hypothetical protein